MTIRLFSDLELFQPPATMYDIAIFPFAFALANLSIDVLPCLLIDVFRDVPVPKFNFELAFPIFKLIVFALSRPVINKRSL